MSTTKRNMGRYVIPVLTATAVGLLSVGALAAGSSSTAKRPVKPATTSVASAKPAAKPASSAKSEITISLSSRIRRGNLVVTLNGTPVFNEKFEKATFAISQTTTWNPVVALPGKYKLSAQVSGENGKTYESDTYNLQLSGSKGIEILIKVKGDKLTIDQVS